MQPEVDERLLQALKATASADGLIDVVVRFDLVKPTDQTNASSLMERREQMAAQTSERIEGALQQARQDSGAVPVRVSLFPSVGSAFVQAPAKYLRALLDQSGVIGATLNSSSSKP
jgi:hypothetical protein